MSKLITPFGFASTTSDVLRGVNLAGKTALVSRRELRDRSRDGPRAGERRRGSRRGRPPRQGGQRRSQEQIAESTGNPHLSHVRLDLDGPGVGRACRRWLERPAAHLGQQRRHHGRPGTDPHRAGPRAAIRHQLPGPLRADGRAAHGARGGRPSADRLAELERAPAQPRRLRGTPTSGSVPTTSNQAYVEVEDRSGHARGRGNPALVGRRYLCQRRQSRRHRHRTPEVHRRPENPGRAPQVRRAGSGNLGIPGCSPLAEGNRRTLLRGR